MHPYKTKREKGNGKFINCKLTRDGDNLRARIKSQEYEILSLIHWMGHFTNNFKKHRKQILLLFFLIKQFKILILIILKTNSKTLHYVNI